jgi:TRAP-type C4-dicarboxylate transport system permease small subunit
LLGDLPAWWFQSIMPAAFALMTWQFLVQSIKRLRGAAPAAEPVP